MTYKLYKKKTRLTVSKTVSAISDPPLRPFSSSLSSPPFSPPNLPTNISPLMESEKFQSQSQSPPPSPSPSPIPTPIPLPIQSAATTSAAAKSGTKSRTKTRIPKSKTKKSKTESPSATIIYVPVLVQSLPSDASAPSSAAAGGKSGKAAQPMLSEQQMKDWRCQADSCSVEAPAVGRYYQRHRICPEHSKAPSVLFNGTHQRYCQQCSRFHELTEFDGSRRSCRRQLCRRRLLRTLNTFSNEEVEQL